MKTKTVSYETRFGKTVEFNIQEKKYTGQLPGESFITSLVRCFYPRVYRRHQKLRAVKA